MLASTHPSSIETVLAYVRDKYPSNEIMIAEGSHVSSQYIDRYEIGRIANQYTADICDLNIDESDWSCSTHLIY